MKAAKERVFCVGVSLGVVGILGLDFFARFEDSHPGVAIRYEERPDILCDEGLRQGLYDFAFTVTPYDDAFQTRHLFSMGLSMWVNAANPLCAKGRVSIEDLASNVLAMPGCGFKNFHRVQSMCSARGVAPKRLFQSHQMYWIFNFVKEGGGIGTNVDTLLLEPEFQSDLVVSLPFEDFSYRFGLSWDRRRKLNDVEEGFLAYAASTCRALEERTSQGMRERERRMARR